MSNERDELAREVFKADNWMLVNADADADWEALSKSLQAGKTYAHRIADGLIAAGYRKARTITTAEELAELPAGSVIRDDNDRLWEWVHIGYGGVDKALSAMGIGSMLAPVAFRHFPATVLYEPEAGS